MLGRILRSKSFTALACAALLAVAGQAPAQQIVPDGRTATTLAIDGNVTDVSTATHSGANAFNSFSRFNVNAGNVVNLHVPLSAANLINIVRDERTNVHGILNSIRDGRIGGSVFFANPHGLVVGASGVINVGGLSVATPTQSFVDNFFFAPGSPNEQAVQQLLAGTAPRNGTGLISIEGQVNAIDDVRLLAGTLDVGGSLYAGARFIGDAPDFHDVVNTNGIDSATNVVMKEGRILLVADSDVALSGTVAAPGGAGVNGGEITVRAGGDVALNAGANVTARGNGEDSAGGTINIWADNDAVARQGARVDASAGASGDGGFIEFSAKRSVELAGGEFRAAAPGGQRGTVLIDPETVAVSADFYTGGADHVIEADESITVNAGVTVSSRNVVGAGGADQASAASQGDSGNLTLRAPLIELLSGSGLFAHADGGFQGGDVLLSATRSGGELDVLSDSAARISLSNATVTGRDVTFTASAAHDSSIAPIVTKNVSAAIDIEAGTIAASRDLALGATASVDASTPDISPFGTVDVAAEAAVNVYGASDLSAGGDAALSVDSTVTARVLPGLPDFVELPGDAGVAIALVDSKATVDVGGASAVDVTGALQLAAGNMVDVEAIADASASGSTAVGGTLALAVIDTTTRAAIRGDAGVTDAGAIAVSAESANAIVASATAAAGGAQEQGAPASQTEETLGTYQDDASTSDGGVTVAAAVAVTDLDSTTQAYLDSTGPVTSSGAVEVSSRASNQSEVTADGSSSEGGVGVGVGVALNLAKLTNEAYVAQTVNANGLTVEALTAGADNRFITSATAGAGASNVGVAGALAVNTVENRTRALIAGTGAVNVGGGDVRVESENESESTAEAKPADGGASGDSVGIGASVAINVATNETRAALEDGSVLDDARDVALAATGTHTVAAKAEAGAAGGVGLTPVVAVTVADNTTTARLGTGGTLTLGGELTVNAVHSGATESAATADAAGDKVAVGASVAVNVVNDAALATTARAIHSTGGGVAFAATAQATSSAFAEASAKGGKEEDESTPEDGVDQEIGKQKNAGTSRQAAGSSNQTQQASSAQTSEGKVSVAGAVAVNVADSSAAAYVPDGGSVTAGGGALEVSASNNTDASATADGSAAGSTAAVGVGVGVAINTVNASTQAYLGAGSNVTARGVSVNAGMTDAAGDGSDLANTFTAQATSGAGGGKVGIAGSLALNVVDVHGEAGIRDGAAVNAGGGDVEVAAESNSGTTAKALPDGPASGGKVGVGASVALNLFERDLARARIGQGASITGAGDLTISATSDSDTVAEAEAGAAGSVAVDAVVALSDVKQSTEAVIASGERISAGGSVSVEATATGDHLATATGDVESSNVGVGASAAVILSNTTTTASLERDLSAGGDISVGASAARSYEAIAKAGAGGGKDADSTTQAEKDKARSTSTLKKNQGAQRGTGKTGSSAKVNVAAAAGVLVLDDDVSASVAADRTLEAGGDLAVSAFNSSDFSARGLGNTLDITKLTGGAQVGIGIGVGLAIVANDTTASIGAGSHVRDAGDITVSAESKQNTSEGFTNKLAAEGVAGAGSSKVGVAGALGVATSNSNTRASIGDGVAIENAGAVSVTVDNTSKLSAKAWSAATSGKVGVGASIATIVTENEYQASVGNNADIDAASLEVATRNHEVSGDVPFDLSLDDISSLGSAGSKLTESNLQVMLGENNYYTETIAGAGGGQVAVTGAFSVNVFDDTTEAWIGENAEVSATDTVEVTAANDATAKAFAGGVSLAGKVGVGIATADIVNSSETRAYLAHGAHIEQAASVSLGARAALDLMAISASAAGAGNAGVAGVLSLVLSENTVEAYADESSTIDSDGALAIEATNTLDLLNIAGVAGVGGRAGVGASAGTNLVQNQTRAWIGTTATVDAAGMTSIDASSSEDVLSVVVGGAGGGTAGVAASASVNVFNPVTEAWIDTGALVNTQDPLADQSRVRVSADSTTDLLSIVGTVGIGGRAGVGGAADVMVVDKTTQAWIAGAGSDVRAGRDLVVLADSAEKVRSVGAGFSAGGVAGVQGSASVVTLSTDTQAYAADGARLHSDGNVVIAADGSSELDMLAGAIGAAGTAAVGAGAAVAIVDKKTHAWIGNGAEVTALGQEPGIEVATGDFNVAYSDDAAGEGEVDAPGITPSNGEDDVADGSEALKKTRESSAGTKTIQGLAVTATNQDSLEGFAVTGAASGTASVTLSGDVSVHSTDTQAWIGDGARINRSNAGAGPGQSVHVAAGNDSYHLGIAGALAASGTVGVGVGADVAVMNHVTKARIGDMALVDARRDVDVAATSTQEVVSISASLGASGTVAVSGSVSVLDFNNETWASIGDGAEVDAGGNVAVTAQDDTDTTMIAGTVALGLGGGGIGGGVGVTTIDKDTRAWVGDGARVDARGRNTGDLTAHTGDSLDGTTSMRGLLVEAQSSEDLFTISAAGAGGLYVGIAGAVSVETVDSDTLAFIGNGAQINTSGGAAHADQDVNVTARNDFDLFNVSGALGAGAVGIAGAVDVGVIRNDTTAFIGDDATVNAARDVDVNALARKDIETYVVSAAGGLAGIAAGVGVYSVGGALDGESQDRLKSDDGDETTGSYADEQATNGSITDEFLADYSDPNIQAAAADADSARAGTAVSGRFTETETRTLPAGNAAFIGKNTVVDAGRHVDVDARESVEFDMLTGALAVGAVGLGAGVGVANFQNDNRAFIDHGATITAGPAGNVTVNAQLDEDLGALGVAGTGGTIAVDAAVAILDSGSSVFASLGSNVTVDRAHAIRVEADDERTLEAETTGVSVGTVAAGASVATATIGGAVSATIGSGAQVGQGAHEVNDVAVSAEANHAATADALAAKGGLGLAASGTVASARIDPAVTAAIGGNSRITVQDEVEIDAVATVAATAEATGINVSLGGSVGASIAEAKVAPRVSARLDANSTVEADELTISARQLVPGSGRSADASATGAAGGLLLGANASKSLAQNTGQVRASVGDDSTLDIDGTATVSAHNDTAQSAKVSGVSVGIVALGANLADAISSTLTHATVGNNVRATGGSLVVRATGTDVNRADAVAGSGGVVSGAAASADTTSTSNTLARTGRGSATRQLAVDTLAIHAEHTTRFNGSVDSLNASIVGASGAIAQHHVFSTVTAGIGDAGRVSANNVDIDAENRSHKFWLGADTKAEDAAVNPDDVDWNINSGSGGLIDLPAGSSKTNITQVTTAGVGADADVHVLMPGAGNGLFNMDALNEIIVHDKAKLDSGGAVAVAKAVSYAVVDSALASVVFSEGAQVVSDLGDINAGARAVVDLDTRSSADTYGLAGAPSGEAYSIYNGLNQAIVNDGAFILADDGNVRLAGGQSSSGAPTHIDADADVRLWNKTAIPIDTEPDAQSNIVNNAAVSVLGASSIESGGNISLFADKGSVGANATGIGKDIYRETAAEIASGISNLFGGDDVSFDIHGGSTSVAGVSNVTVDGELLAGIHRTESLTLDFVLLPDSACASPPCWELVATPTDGVDFTVDPAVGLAANIQERIQRLRDLMAQYAGDPVAVAAYSSEITFLEHKLVELGLAAQQADGSVNVGQWNNPSPREQRRGEIVVVQSDLSGFTTTVITAGGTVVTTTTSALGTVTTFAGNVDTVVSNNGAISATNDTIRSKLQALGNFNAAHPDYVALTGKLSESDSLETQISSLKALNATDQVAVSTKNSEIDGLLADIDGLKQQLSAHVNDLTQGDIGAGDQIVAVQAQIDAKQAAVGTRTAAVNNLLGDISGRNQQINTKTSALATVNTQINDLENSLEVAFSIGSDTDNATVAQINGLQGSNTALNGAIDSLASANAGHQSTFAGFASTVAAENGTISATLADPDLDIFTARLSDFVDSLPGLSDVPANGPIADFVHVDDITVRLGSIDIRGDNLRGTGELKAPGDARIDITNNTPNFLVVNDLAILSDEGGTLRLNGVLVNSNSDINRVNRAGAGANFADVITRDVQSAPKPAITITSNYDPLGAAFANLPAPAPNIELNGDITNLRGSVTVHSKAGSILTSGLIRAGTVDIKAENGDFVQSFVDGFSHVGGDPASIHDFETPLGTGIIANGSVFISARYLNINSLIQSGIENWKLTLFPDGGNALTGPASFYGVDQAKLDHARQEFLNGHGPPSVNLTPPDAPAGALLHYNARADRLEANAAYAFWDMTREGWAARTAGLSGLYPLVQLRGDNIGASLDPMNDRFVLDGEAVRGGYIQLFGQILNTSNNGAGKLRVLDGYGQIAIHNSSGREVVLNRLDAGADPTGTGRGTAGKIDITDIRVINADNSSDVIHTVYTRDYDVVSGTANVNLEQEIGRIESDGTFTLFGTLFDGSDPLAADGRNTRYHPKNDLRFVWTTGSDNSSVKYWQFKGPQLFGFRTSQPTGEVISESGPFVLNRYRLDDGTYLSTAAELGSDHASDSHFEDTSVNWKSGSSRWVKTDEWTDCNWWTLCIASEYNSKWTETFPNKTITTKSLNADYPIAIEFMGRDRGLVTVNSAANVILNGDIRNNAGATSINASGGSIIQGNDTALITATDLTLSAAGSVGGALGGNPVRSIQTSLDGVLNASAGNGNVLVTQTAGELRAGSVIAAGTPTAGTGKVILQSDGSIVAASGMSLVQGGRVELTSDSGGIGSIDAPLAVNVGYVDNLNDRRFYGLKAEAAGDIGVTSAKWSGNAAGDLLIDTVVSHGGDALLAAPGRILDNNPLETIDTRTWDELLNFWDSLGLREGEASNQAKQQQAIESFENGVTQDYRLYWLIRQRQEDGGASHDPTFQYRVTAGERTALAGQGMSDADIAAFEASRTEQYRALHEEVGDFTGDFEQGFRYAATEAEREQILDGSSWTDRELGISITPGLLKDITNTNPVVKAPNVDGRNVTLQAGVAVGETLAGITVPTDIDPATLTDAQKVALAAAERSDLTITDELITVRQRKAFNFAARDSLNLSVGSVFSAHSDHGRAFLASLGDARLGTIEAPKETRIKVRGSIVNVTGSLVQTGDLVLEAANGAIGSDGTGPGQLVIDLLPDATLIARAAGDVDIVEEDGDLNVDTVYSRQDAALTAQDSILDAHPAPESELNVLADNIAFSALTGSIGDSGNALDVGVELDGRITASAPTVGAGGGIYLNGPVGSSFNIGDVDSGDAIELSADIDMLLDGLVQGPGAIGLVAGNELRMTPDAHVHATTLGLLVNVGSLFMEDDGTKAARMTIDVGTTSINTEGDAVLTGILTTNASESAIEIIAGGSILDGGDVFDDIIANSGSLAKLTLNAGGTIGNDPVDLRLQKLQATSRGLMHIDVKDSVHVDRIEAGGELVLNALGGSITGDFISAQSARLRARDDIDLASLLTVSFADLEANRIVLDLLDAGSASLRATDSITLGTGLIDGLLSMNAGTNIDIGSVDAGSLDVHAGNGIDVGTVQTDGSLRLDAGMITADFIGADSATLLARDSIDVELMHIESLLNLGGDDISANVVHTGTDGMLKASLGNYDGGPATFVDLTMTSPIGISFDGFAALDGTLAVPDTFLRMRDMFVGNRFEVDNGDTFLVIDNTTVRPDRSADILLYAPDRLFDFDLSGTVLQTDPRITRYRKGRTHTVLPFLPEAVETCPPQWSPFCDPGSGSSPGEGPAAGDGPPPGKGPKWVQARR